LLWRFRRGLSGSLQASFEFLSRAQPHKRNRSPHDCMGSREKRSDLRRTDQANAFGVAPHEMS
ncbi:hypothetical protein, partial [Rhodoblastus sp.]|uniref:hypothetical protein n=1 Tax=Rhodoblastus sp. TaxID=1962975 RepID=UPI0026071380